MAATSVRSRPRLMTAGHAWLVLALALGACASEDPASVAGTPDAVQTADQVVGAVLKILPPAPSPEATGTLLVETSIGPRQFHVWPSTVVVLDGREQPCGADCLGSLEVGTTVQITKGDEYLSLPAQWDALRLTVR